MNFDIVGVFSGLIIDKKENSDHSKFYLTVQFFGGGQNFSVPLEIYRVVNKNKLYNFQVKFIPTEMKSKFRDNKGELQEITSTVFRVSEVVSVQECK